MNHFSRQTAVFLMGFFAIAAQILLIRELLITFSGNELSIGIFLANWLLLEAIGSFSAPRLTGKIKAGITLFAGLQVLLALIFPAVIYLARSIKSYPGETASLPLVFLSSLLLIAPVALINGAQFSIGCRINASEQREPAQTVGRVYMIEGLGSLSAGLVVTYLFLQYLNNFQAGFLLSILTLLSALFLLAANKREEEISLRRLLLIGFQAVLLFLFVLALFFRTDSYLQDRSSGQQWPGYRLVDYINSIYGNTALLERDGQFDLLSDGVPVLSLPVPDIITTEDLAHLPLLSHPQPKNIFLVGGGPGGLLAEILKHPVRTVDYAELDPNLIGVLKKNLPDSLITGLTDPRLQTHYNDGRFFLGNTSQSFDIIILNLPDPSTMEINRFYTREFFSLCRARLRAQGILAFTLTGSASYMNPSLTRLNACLSETASAVFKFQHIFAFQTNLFLLSDDPNILDIPPDLMTSRLLQRNIDTQMLSSAYLNYKLDPRRQSEFREAMLSSRSAGINSDLLPQAVYLDILFLHAPLSPLFFSLYDSFRELSLYQPLLLIVLLFIILVLFQQKQKPPRRVPVHTVIFSTGFTGIGLSMIMILAFQALYGFIFFWIGMIISGFMAGLSAGSYYMSGHLTRIKSARRILLLTEIGQVFYFFCLAAGLAWLSEYLVRAQFYSAAPYMIIVLTVFNGLLTGIQFPLTNQVNLDQNSFLSRSAGTLYASDLAGSWLAGLIVTLVLIPILGLIETSIILLGIKICSTFLVWRCGCLPGLSPDKI